MELKNHCPVFVTKVDKVDDVIPMILNLGKLTFTNSKALDISKSITQKLNNIKTNSFHNNKVVYLIWKNPYMICGNDTFINSMLKLFKFENAFKDLNRYPEVSSLKIKESCSDYIFLSSEPYPFKEKHLKKISQESNTKALLVDGEDFSWFGSRLIQSLDRILKLKQSLHN